MNRARPSKLNRKESATLAGSYAGEAGRGIFQSLGADFAMLVAVSHFGAHNVGLLWLLSSAPFVGYLLSLLSAPLSRYRRKKSLVLAFELSSRILVLITTAARGAAAFVLPMALAQVVANLASPLVSGIYGANFCTLARGPAVARLQMVRLGSVAVCGAVFTGILRAGGGDRFRWIILGAGALALGLALVIRRIPESRHAPASSEANSLRDCLRIMSGDRSFMFLELCWFLLGLANLLVSPLRVLRLHDLGYSDSLIMLCTTASMFAAMVLSMPIWGRWLYRMNLAVYRALSNLFIMAGILVFFQGHHPGVVCLGSALWGAGLAGGGLCWRLVATFFTPPDRGPAYMSVHTFLCGLRGLLGPVLGLWGYGAAVSTNALSMAALAGLGLSSLMVLGLVPALERRAASLGHS